MKVRVTTAEMKAKAKQVDVIIADLLTGILHGGYEVENSKDPDIAPVAVSARYLQDTCEVLMDAGTRLHDIANLDKSIRK